MKRYFSGMTAQQAPSPRAARQALVSLPGTLKTASQRPHCARLATIFTSSAIRSSVIRLEEIDENKLARSQRQARRVALEPDCGRLSVCESSTSAAELMTLALHQRDARVVPVHEQADAKADGEEHRH